MTALSSVRKAPADLMASYGTEQERRVGRCPALKTYMFVLQKSVYITVVYGTYALKTVQASRQDLAFC